MVPGGQPQLDRSTSSVGSNSTFWPQARPGDPVEQPGAGPLAEQPHRLMHRRQRRVAQAAGEDVVESDHGDVVGHADARLGSAPAARRSPSGRWRRRPRQASWPRSASSSWPASSPLPTLNNPCELPTSWQSGLAAQHVHQRPAPLAGVGRGRRPVHVVEPPPAVLARSGASTRATAPERLSAVTTSAARSRGLPAITTTGSRSASLARNGDGTIPSPISRPSTLPDSDSSLGRSGSLRLFEVGDQQRPVLMPDPRLDAAQDLVVEEQAHALDVVLQLQRLALDADQADHVLAAPGQALRGAVGDVAELLDDVEHARPGGVPDPVHAVHHPGHGRRRHARPCAPRRRASRRCWLPASPGASRSPPIRWGRMARSAGTDVRLVSDARGRLSKRLHRRCLSGCIRPI